MSDFTVANVMKLQLCYYAKGGRDAKAVRVEIGKAKAIEDIFAIVEKYFFLRILSKKVDMDYFYFTSV